MIELLPGEVTPAIVALFDPTGPTMPRAFNVLEGTVHGHILVDDPAPPAWAVVCEATYGTLYLGGSVTAPLLAALIERFRPLGGAGIGCWPEDMLNAMLPPGPDYDGRTLYFPERSPRVPLEPMMGPLPEGLTLAPRDARLLARSFDYADTLAAFGTVENALRHTFGVMLLRDDVVLCEAATGAPTGGRIEVGVATAEGYRGRGLATLACAHLIQLCEAQGLATWWDCAKQNTASGRLARKLGFVGEREYRYVWWAKREPQGSA